MDIQQEIIQQDSARVIEPEATWVWVLSSLTAQEIDRARPLVSRDLLKLGILAVESRKPCYLITQLSDPVANWCIKAASNIQGINCVILGRDFVVPNPLLVCAKTADFAIMYGNPTEKWDDLMAQLTTPVPLVTRTFAPVGSESQPLYSDPDPYAKYKAIVELVREWYVEPYRGLQTRDLIDIRPHRQIV